MNAAPGQHRGTPQFTAERALYATRATYRSACAVTGADAAMRVVPQLGRGPGGFGAADSCDGCATFSYIDCLNDCAGDADCRAACLARAFECDLCRVDLPFSFGGGLRI